MPLPQDWYKDLTHGPHWEEVHLEDEIFEVTQRGAKALETKWSRHTGKWLKQLKRAVSCGVFGLGTPECDWRFLYKALYSKRWPSGLSREEKRLLHLARAVNGFHRSYTQGIETDHVLNPEAPRALPSSESLLRGLKRLAALVKAETFKPMVKNLLAQQKVSGKLIQPLCDQVYANTARKDCSLSAAENMFVNDLQRGSHAKNLRVSPTMYRTLPAFFALHWEL